MFTDQMYHQCPVLQPLSSTTAVERKWKSNAEIAPNCPRCASPNTKFCYYNNYSLSQPRYFCKGCRRYWTKGGSLRNVPVGGGCRKNRRSNKSARLSQSSGRLSENNFNSFDEQTAANSFSSDSDSVVQSGTATNGPDIDLAVVFAKFLNDSSSNNKSDELVNQELGTTETAGSVSLTPDSLQSDAMIECQKLSDHDIMEETNLLEEFSQVFDQKQQDHDHHRIQDLLENDMNMFGLQTWLSDEAVQDAAALPNFTWQLPTLQFQDFDSFPAEHDHLKTSATLITDNWSSFDLSGFEIYSRP